jgi:hypothetical protein
MHMRQLSIPRRARATWPRQGSGAQGPHVGGTVMSGAGGPPTFIKAGLKRPGTRDVGPGFHTGLLL